MSQIMQISVWDKSKSALIGRTSIKMSELLPPKTGLEGWFELFPLPQGDTTFKIQAPANPKEFHIALYDYTPGCDKELLLRKSDLLKVIKDEKEWVMVENAITGGQGFVPATFIALNMSLSAEPWFFGNISRQKAEKLLGNPMRKHGCFLIRESEVCHPSSLPGLTYISPSTFQSQPGQYSLSMKDGESVRHYRIQTETDGKFRLQGVCFLMADMHQSLTASLVDEPRLYKSPRARSLPQGEEIGSHQRTQGRVPEGASCQVCPYTLLYSTLPSRASDLSYETKDKWEVPREQIELVKVLGQGQYGEVYRGKWKGTIDVAVKTLKDATTTVEEFLEEAQLMKVGQSDIAAASSHRFSNRT